MKELLLCYVGQAVSLRRVVNPPSDQSTRASGGKTSLRPCRNVGQVVNLRPSGTRPGERSSPAREKISPPKSTVSRVRCVEAPAK